MFTGIVQEIGIISSKEKTNSGISIEVDVEPTFLKNLEIGASIAVNGVCLTVTKFNENSVAFDVIPETLRVTNLEEISVSSKVNLERSLKFGDEVELAVECPDEWVNYIFLKGYVAINGASLTVAKKTDKSFSVFLIPETLSATNLSEVQNGNLLNIEVDQTTYAAVKAAEARLAET